MKLLPLSAAFLLVFLASSFTRPVPSAPPAQVDYFLYIEGVDGESAHKDHKNWINVASCNMGGHKAGGGGTAQITRQSTAKASAKLMLICVEGRHYDEVILHLRSATDPQTFRTLVLQDVVFSSYQVISGSSVPMESFAMNYTQAVWR